MPPGTLATNEDKEGLDFKIPPGWTVANKERQGEILATEWVKERDDIDHWKELLGIQTVPKYVSSPEEMYQRVKADGEKNCPGSKWDIIEKDANSITYEW